MNLTHTTTAHGAFEPEAGSPPRQACAPPPPHARAALDRARDVAGLLRVHHWVKNGFVLLPAFFGGRLFAPAWLPSALLACAAFCLASSVIYVFNDLMDMEEDRLHPSKQNRPLAAGRLSPARARTCMGLLLAALGAALLALGSPAVAGFIGLYLALNLAYSLKLKHLSIVDVVCIALGFVLRVAAGAAAVDVPPSHWIILVTFLLSLFLGLSKRRDDLLLAEGGSPIARRSLPGYNCEFVSMAMVIMAGVTLFSYVMYTLSPEVVQYHGAKHLYLTSLWVICGFLRYMQLIFVRNLRSSPTRLLLGDRPLQAVILLWLAHFLIPF